MSNSDNSERDYDIAVIGMAARFPGAKDLDHFWSNLRSGVESISFFNEEELKATHTDLDLIHKKNYVPARSILEDVELFDASFFGLSPREAQITDPQHRIFLECVVESLENAGYDPDRYPGRIGLFAGVSANSYLLNYTAMNRGILESVTARDLRLGNDKDYMPTRASYILNLKGPSVSVQTACSTSLVALHLACQSLLSRESDIALAGASTVTVPQKKGYVFHEGSIDSPDGHCRAFDAKAAGTVFGNGVGLVVVKRFNEALEDGDCIHAVIKSSAVNNDGAMKVGYTAPSVEGQAEVIREALDMARVDAETIAYVETHGTGTSIGDVIEITALKKAFRQDTRKKGFCAIGSVKTNVGHLDLAAGAASLIKTIFALEHRQIPPNLHFERNNPELDLEDSPFFVNKDLSEWSSDQTPRRAGVSAFGIGGTNAHVILEEAPRAAAGTGSRPCQLLLLSAKSKAALGQATANLAEALKRQPELNLADVAYTLQVGRKAFAHRRVVVCRDVEDAVSILETPDPQRVFTDRSDERNRPVTFLFPGQGAQYVGMAEGLYRGEPSFREHVDQCSRLLGPALEEDLRDVLFPDSEHTEEAARKLVRTRLTQPALFVIEYALARLWMSWGIRPDAMMGHSVGEYVAACLAGVFSLADALTLVAARGRLMDSLPEGSMLSVSLSPEEVNDLLDEEVSLAASNSPSQCVVSGFPAAVAKLEELLEHRGVETRSLKTSHAFHSPMMEPILDTFSEEVKKVDLAPPQIPYVSNVTGTWITAEETTDPAYWSRHLRRTVRFAEGCRELSENPDRVFLEVGPGRTLGTLVRQQQKATKFPVLTSIRHPQDEASDQEFLLTTLGQLWLNGVDVGWSELSAHERRRRVPLPTYPFERQRFWIDPLDDATQSKRFRPRGSRDISDWFYLPSWKRSMPPVPPPRDTTQDPATNWLVFADESGFAQRITEALRERGHTVSSVEAGSLFEDLGDDSWTVDPRDRESFKTLLKSLKSQGRDPEAILYLWSVDPAVSDPGQTSWEQDLDSDFFSLLFLAQALGDHVSTPIRLWVVSNQLHEVTGEEEIDLTRSTLLGPCRVAPLDYPNISCSNVDVALSASADPSAAVGQVLAELATEASERHVAYRHGHRWLESYEPARLERRARQPDRLRPSGVYLVTGGLGSMGLAFSEYLADAVSAKLVLVGRSGLPPREEWENRLSENPGDPSSSKISKILELEAMGAEVLPIRADVTDLEQMRSALEAAHQRFGKLDGVIHTAGVLGQGIMALKKKDEASRVLAPKVRGTLILDHLLQGEDLDFFVLCSSISSVAPLFGQVDYCAANSFLDAFARNRARRSGTSTISIDWGFWQELGMAGKADLPAGVMQELVRAVERNKKEGFANAGVEVLRRILSDCVVPQIVVSRKEVQYHIEEQNTLILQEMQKSTRVEREALNLEEAYVPPRNEIEKTIAEIWQDLLGIEQVGIYDDFFVLGGHSLLAASMISRLREAFGVDVALRSTFDASTLEKLADLVAHRQFDQAGDTAMAQMLEDVKHLSEEEVQALLLAEEGSIEEEIV